MPAEVCEQKLPKGLLMRASIAHLPVLVALQVHELAYHVQPVHLDTRSRCNRFESEALSAWRMPPVRPRFRVWTTSAQRFKPRLASWMKTRHTPKASGTRHLKHIKHFLALACYMPRPSCTPHNPKWSSSQSCAQLHDQPMFSAPAWTPLNMQSNPNH